MALASLSLVRERKLWDLDHPREVPSQEQVDKKTYSLCMKNRPRGRATCPHVKLAWPPLPLESVCLLKTQYETQEIAIFFIRQSSGYTYFVSSYSNLSFQLISDVNHPLESAFTSLFSVMVMDVNSVQDILKDTIVAPACTCWGFLWLLWSKWAPRNRVIPFSLYCPFGRGTSIEE